MDVTRDGFLISDDIRRIDREAVWAFISHAYWARNRSREQHERALDRSLCLGVYRPVSQAGASGQMGFARIISDYAITAHIADVYILEPYRGQGLGKWLVQTILDHPELKLVRRFTLNTDDAQGLYARYGFGPLRQPSAMMELWRGGPW